MIKSFAFKGGSRQFSNRYHFNGGTPADDTHWHTLMDNVVAAEKATADSSVTIVEAIGYAAGSEVPVSTKVYSTAGTFTVGGGSGFAAGESAALVRYSTAARSTKNHPIYLFNYYHGIFVGVTDTTRDTLHADQRTAFGTYASAWIAGFSDGTHTLVRASPNGAGATGSLVEEYVTHRDFPYTSSV